MKMHYTSLFSVVSSTVTTHLSYSGWGKEGAGLCAKLASQINKHTTFFSLSFSFLFLFSVLEFELKSLALARHALCHVSQATSPANKLF
jgi:hypothetical protein